MFYVTLESISKSYYLKAKQLKKTYFTLGTLLQEKLFNYKHKNPFSKRWEKAETPENQYNRLKIQISEINKTLKDKDQIYHLTKNARNLFLHNMNENFDLNEDLVQTLLRSGWSFIIDLVDLVNSIK